MIEKRVALSGLTKQEYITRRLQEDDVIVNGNPRVYKALRNQMGEILEELRRIGVGESVDPDLQELIRIVAITMNGMKEETDD